LNKKIKKILRMMYLLWQEKLKKWVLLINFLIANQNQKIR